MSAIPEPDPERERKRQHLIYDSSIENDGKKRQMYEIRPGHFVYATEAEAKIIKKKPKLDCKKVVIFSHLLLFVRSKKAFTTHI